MNAHRKITVRVITLSLLLVSLFIVGCATSGSRSAVAGGKSGGCAACGS